MKDSFDLLLAGTGGQGILLTSRLLMGEAIARGVPVRGAETHGMAQRGGSVVAHVRFGPCESSMVLPLGAQLLVGVDATEALRNLRFLAAAGTVLVNTPPLAFDEPSVMYYLARIRAHVITMDALELARKKGYPRSVNMLMLGLAAALPQTPFTPQGLLEAIASEIRPRFRESARAALRLGATALASGLATRHPLPGVGADTP